MLSVKTLFDKEKGGNCCIDSADAQHNPPCPLSQHVDYALLQYQGRVNARNVYHVFDRG